MGKKLLPLFFGIFIFMIIPKNVFASATRIVFYNSSHGVLYETYNPGYELNLNLQNVRYIRVYFDDINIGSQNYKFFIRQAISIVGGRPAFTSNQIYLNGNAVQSSVSDVTNYDEMQTGSSTFYRDYSFNINYSASTSTSNIFYEGTFGQDVRVVFYNLKNAIFYTTGNGNNDVLNQGFNNMINNNNQNTQNIINNDNKNTQDIINSQKDIKEEQEKTNEKLDDINNTLNDDNTDDAEEKASSFFDNFESNEHGLSGIVSSPLRLINSLSSSSCSPLRFPLPIVHNEVVLPCLSPIYEQYANQFLTIYRIITTGLIGYWVVIRLFFHVKNIQNPDSDRMEVFDL